MDTDLRSQLGQRVLILDGALGTELYARGVFINRSYDELNLSSPDVVRAVHRDYLNAGAELLTTNTFGANRCRLQPFGLEERADDIVRAGVRLAREIAGKKAWVLGSMGPTGARLAPLGRLSPGTAYAAFKAQAKVMADEGVDAILLETFTSLAELWQAVRAAHDVAPKVPLIASMSFAFDLDNVQVEGEQPENAARVITGWDVDAIGVNCSNGPAVVLSVVERMARVTTKPLLAAPNAGLPQVVDGRTLYLAGPEYMAEYARRMVAKGASIVGGCCGTTPAMIREIRSFVRSVAPAQRTERPVRVEEADQPLPEVPVDARSEFARKLSRGDFCISVELDPPRGLDPSKSIEGAAWLHKQGIDVINIADGPRAVARMGPLAMAQLANRACGIESVIHYCCRDRNLLGMQMDLIGAHALGQHNVLAVTGDPPKMGTYPNATAVFDIDSIGLITFITMMNRGLDFSGRSIGGQTRFFVGAGCNPAHVDLDREVERFGKKIEAGAQYFFSQPVYDAEVLQRFLDRTEQFPKVPFLVGILPLISYKNAEFMHNEIPGMQVPSSIRERLRDAPSRDAQREIGIEIARDTLAEVYRHPRVRGAYIYPPFGSYKAVMRVVECLPRFQKTVE